MDTSFGYTDSELRSALESLSSDPDACRHMYGYGGGGIEVGHELSMLQKITAVRILDYGAVKSDPDSPSESDLLSKASAFRDENGPALDLRSVIRSRSPSMALAAEFKRASPSKGDIAPDLRAGEQASKYAEAGASIISVLTEGRWFRGSMDDLTEVRLATAGGGGDDQRPRPAVLRKDFVVDGYQIAEAAAGGADSVLLIVAVTPSDLLRELIAYSRSLGMEPLVEVHADSELDVALDAGAGVIGVNNRDLHTFRMDLSTTERAAEELRGRGLDFDRGSVPDGGGEGGPPPPEYCLCALSGMSSASDVDRYRSAGVGMCLIGESLMRAADPAAAIAALRLDPTERDGRTAEEEAGGAGGGAYTGGLRLVKVCGITDPEDALTACRAGANLIGVIFAERSKRRVTPEMARAVADAVRSFGERTDRARVPIPTAEEEEEEDGGGASPLAALRTRARSLESAAAGGRPLVVGVFQNQPEEYVRDMVARCGLDLVQLHGDEGMEAASEGRCGAPAIRVVDVETGSDGGSAGGPGSGECAGDGAGEGAAERLLASVTSDPVAILLDTSVGGSGGGTGVTFDWSLAESVQSRGLPVIVAGGLNPDNVGECVGGTRPWGVDVSSGVEASPGRKDGEKVRAFLRRARDAAEEAGRGGGCAVGSAGGRGCFQRGGTGTTIDGRFRSRLAGLPGKPRSGGEKGRRAGICAHGES